MVPQWNGYDYTYFYKGGNEAEQLLNMPNADKK